MEMTHWISITAAFIVAIGWFVTAYFNRQKDIAQKRLDYRLRALESFLLVHDEMLKDHGISDKRIPELNRVVSNFRVYGLDDEQKLINDFIVAIKKGANNLEETNTIFYELSDLIISRIRNELGYKQSLQ